MVYGVLYLHPGGHETERCELPERTLSIMQVSVMNAPGTRLLTLLPAKY